MGVDRSGSGLRAVGAALAADRRPIPGAESDGNERRLGRYIGRVGALAVALGIGVVIGDPAIAWAEDTTAADTAATASSSSLSSAKSAETSSANSDSGTEKSETTVNAKAARAERQAARAEREAARAERRAGRQAERAARAEQVTRSLSALREPGAGDRVERESVGGPQQISRTGPADVPPRATEAIRTRALKIPEPTLLESGPAPADRPATVDTVKDAIVSTALEAGNQRPAVRETLTSASASATATASPAIAKLTEVGEWTKFGAGTTNGPLTPSQSPAAWAVLGWIRRETQQALLNRRPTINYNAAENVQTYRGVIVGDLKLATHGDDPLSVSVTGQPTNGTVVVNQDGSFVYTPNATTALRGGEDAFEVTVDGRPGNPLHANLPAWFSPNASSTTTETITVVVKPTSPLGTPEQVAAEELAREIVATPQVQAAMASLKASWLATAQAQYALVGGPDPVNEAQLDQAVEEFVFAAALNAQSSDPNNPVIIANLLPPHTWYGETAEGSRVVFDNPDTIYRFVSVSSGSSYVLTGQFAGAMPDDVNFSVAQGGQTTANLNGKDLVVNPDGTFTITVSAEPAEFGQTNHIQLPPDNAALGTTQLLIRDTSSDYSIQAPMTLSVERVGGAIEPTTPPTIDQLANVTVAAMSRGAAAFTFFVRQATVDPTTGQLKPPNTFAQPAQTGGQTLSTQYQTVGYFQLADDEAMVVTIDPGRAGYFVVPITNDWAVTYDYTNQQTSLNNSQAVANPDGTYTIVISPTDPGVANWVSTGVVVVDGQSETVNQGTLYFRFQDLDPDSTVAPTLFTQVVNLDKLDAVLPPTTIYVTPDERAEQLAQRQSDYNSRFNPYPQVSL